LHRNGAVGFIDWLGLGSSNLRLVSTWAGAATTESHEGHVVC